MSSATHVDAPVWDPAADALPSTMRAAMFLGGGRPLELTTVQRPEPGPGEILVKVAACGLCHSDLHYLDHGVPTFKAPPVILGHEVSGTVVKLGAGVDPRRLDESVILSSLTTCGSCVPCRTGRENQCASGKMIGNNLDGGFADYVVAPARDAFPVPPEIPLVEVCVVADALTTAYHAVVRRAGVVAGETVAVFGCGGLGLSVVQVASAIGARVVAIDIDPRKLELARGFGAETTLDAKDPELVRTLRRLTDGGPEVAVEAIGKPAVQEQAFGALRATGRLVLLGFATEPMKLQGGRATYREITVIGTLGCRNVDFPVVLDLVRRGKLDVRSMVTHRYALEDVNLAFDALRRGEGIRHIVVIDEARADRAG